MPPNTGTWYNSDSQNHLLWLILIQRVLFEPPLDDGVIGAARLGRTHGPIQEVGMGELPQEYHSDWYPMIMGVLVNLAP